ncbi:MAG: UDP-N-acetylmuramate--L-alanine ligase [Candidatus Latescibacteria bacterium]|nr:UDP-N-acetylmuramate--L-alanine ligase [Candidatus Latescibacterota bacterium]
MFGRINHIHFVGIGGAGMSGIALVMKNLGYKVTGSDIAKTTLTQYLIKQGIKIAYKHNEKNCFGASVVVYSSAISPNNLELNYARTHKIPVIPRAEMLGELMRVKFSIAISGTHGKTTTTSLISAILEEANLHPTIIIGGKVVGTETAAKLGKSEYLIAEADESDRSFLLLHPTITIITNIEKEHLDYYANISQIRKAFIEFANKVPFYGSVIVNNNSPHVRTIIPYLKRDVITYGLSNDASVRAENIVMNSFHSKFTLRYDSKSFDFKINLPGIHNIENSLAAISVGLKLEVPFSTIQSAFEKFQGLHRRLELKDNKKGITLYDDYAHHPTEIKATLATLRNAYPHHRIFAVFQPHRYTRTKLLGKTFRNAFANADVAIITDIYAASEPKIPGVSSQIIIDAITKSRSHPKVIYIKKFCDINTYLLQHIKAGDVIITLGAGNIWQIGEQLLKTL